MRRRAERLEIACQQVVAEDSRVSSLQWMIVPARHSAAFSPQFLMERYLGYIRRATFSLIRPKATAEGVEFRLLGTSFSVLTFAKPAAMVDGEARAVFLAIRGGLLVQRDRCDRGELSFICEPCGDGIKVMLQLADYCPLLLGGHRSSRTRKWLYRLTQAFIHKRVTVGFLGRIYREVAGKDVCTRVVKVRTMAGEEI